MLQGFWVGAEKNPQRVALIEPDGTSHSAGEIAASLNQLIHGLRARGFAEARRIEVGGGCGWMGVRFGSSDRRLG